MAIRVGGEERTGMMDGKYASVPTRHASIRELERDLLRDMDGETGEDLVLGCLEPGTMLTVFLAISTGFTIEMLLNSQGSMMYYGLVELAANIVGLLAVQWRSTSMLLAFGCYNIASFLISSLMGILTATVVLQKDVCTNVGKLFDRPDLVSLCVKNESAFKTLAILAVFAELGLELFVFSLVQRVYRGFVRPGGRTGCRGTLGI